jgi:hypothetical protein
MALGNGAGGACRTQRFEGIWWIRDLLSLSGFTVSKRSLPLPLPSTFWCFHTTSGRKEEGCRPESTTCCRFVCAPPLGPSRRSCHEEQLAWRRASSRDQESRRYCIRFVQLARPSGKGLALVYLCTQCQQRVANKGNTGRGSLSVRRLIRIRRCFAARSVQLPGALVCAASTRLRCKRLVTRMPKHGKRRMRSAM